MKNKFLIGLLTIVMCLMLVGCGKEKNLNNNLNDNSNSIQTNDNNNSNTSDNVIVDDDEIIDIDDEDNSPPVKNERITVEKVVNCERCVYAYFSDEGDKAKKLGDTLSPSDYTNDINNLKTAGGKQRHNFFGLVLSGNTISKAYSCILKDYTIYCIQGSTDGAYHTNNIGVLNQIFTADQCKYISAGHTYTCTDGDYNGDTITTGYTSLHYETSCTIYGSEGGNSGKLICH